MLLKYNPTNERQFNNGKGKSVRVTSRNLHRKTLRIATKPGKRNPPGKKISFGKNQKNFQASKNIYPPTTSLCDNSNDSGLGFDESHHHHPLHQTLALSTTSTLASTNNNSINYHRSLSKVRYGEVTVQTTPISSTVTKLPTTDVTISPISVGKKVSKNVSNPSTSTTVSKNFTDEDTCNSDDFSSYYQTRSDRVNLKSEEILSSPEHLYSSAGKTLSPSSDRTASSISSLSGSENSPSSIDTLELLPTFSLHNQYSHISKDGSAQLVIIQQPEQQHRARYQTEGSRGAVKDRSGNGFPIVRLMGYKKPATLQVFIGNDVGRVSPHIFYQACKVSGKNSTPCQETKTEGTVLIEIEMKPENDMTVICDCVGILKERNVDVEHRLGRSHTLAASVTRNKKKSTKCRIIFRTKINDDSDCPEVLQLCSNTITCTQPPGVPEICKKSLDSCSVIGGKELFIIGKNFLKDTKVTFVRYDESRPPKKMWEETVIPDKEYLQQTHLICVVPQYPNFEKLHEPVTVQVLVTSSNKKSDAHSFVYFPLKKPLSLPTSPVSSSTNVLFPLNHDAPPRSPPNHQQNQYQNVLSMSCWNDQQVTSTENIHAPQQLVMSRKASFSKKLSDQSPGVAIVEPSITLKTEFIDQTQCTSDIVVSPSDVSTSGQNAMQTSSMFGNNVAQMIDVTNGISFVSQETQALMATSQVQEIIDGFKMPANPDNGIDLHHIKSESSDQQTNSMFPPPPPPQPQHELNSAQQQQVVENLLNMIVQSSVMSNEQSADMMMNQATNSTNSIQSEPLMAMNSPSAIQTSIICESGGDMNTLESSPASTIVSNAVSDATAETQLVMKQMIAQAAAEILSEGPAETQSTINTFISNILPPAAEPQQMQVILAQEILETAVTTSLIQDVNKKEESNIQTSDSSERQGLVNAATATNVTASSALTQPFSPTTQDLTTMSESDLVSFIDPSVFM